MRSVMEIYLYILLYFTGVPLRLSVSYKYYLILQEKNWTEAQTYCRSTYTDLATIRSDADMIRLQTEAQNHQFSSSAWIGLWNDINSCCWSLGDEPLGSFINWVVGKEPNNKGGNQKCARINRWDWADMSCTTQYPFLCFDDSKTGPDRYIYYPDLKTWSDAQTFCRDFHSDLASSRDSTENSALKGMVTANTWFGLFRDSWKWSDQTNTSTIPWMSGQPDNALSHENCGFVSNGETADALCSEMKPFFCYEAPTGQQQIIRLKVRSNQDVNDPAVKAAVLAQIEQKLKDHGMTNVTVKWKEQPGGVVFHKIHEVNGTSAEKASNRKCHV